MEKRRDFILGAGVGAGVGVDGAERDVSCRFRFRLRLRCHRRLDWDWGIAATGVMVRLRMSCQTDGGVSGISNSTQFQAGRACIVGLGLAVFFPSRRTKENRARGLSEREYAQTSVASVWVLLFFGHVAQYKVEI